MNFLVFLNVNFILKICLYFIVNKLTNTLRISGSQKSGMIYQKNVKVEIHVYFIMKGSSMIH